MIGLTTSHEWLNYGPIYYWILIPLVRVFGWSPYILFWLALVVSMAGILITYFVFKRIVNKNFALILSFFVSVSPIWIWITRLAKLHVFFFILSPLIIYFLYKIWQEHFKYMFWLGLAFGALFSFHFSQIPIFLVAFLAFWLKRKQLKIKNYLMFLAGLILPNITVLIYDAKNGFTMIKNLILWVPYRFLGFAGIYQKNNLSVETAGSTASSFNQFFGQNLFWDNRFWILGSFIFAVMFVTFFIQNRKKIFKDFFAFYVISSTIIQCLALLIHTSPPIHYFFPIFLNFGLLFSHFTMQFWQRKTTKILTGLIFILLGVTGILAIGREHTNDIDYIPMSTQERVAGDIVADANGRSFSLVRLGPYDYFPENYSQNYQFLILSKGGKLDNSAKLRYVIYDIGNVYVQKIE